jgi:3-oxoacid CoA-transferase B subunit
MSFDRQLSDDERELLRRAAREVPKGALVNLGIGLPTFLPRFLPEDSEVVLHSENGFVGLGPPLEDGNPDHHVIDAGGRACTVQPGAAFFDSVMSFTIVRGGHLDLSVLGAFEVSVDGDLANWKIPGKLTPGMGGAMELAQKSKQVLVVSRHLDKKGRGKLVASCSLPLTAAACVDTLVTERAVFRRREGRMRLTSVRPGLQVETALEGLDVDVPVDDPLEPWDTGAGEGA